MFFSHSFVNISLAIIHIAENSIHTLLCYPLVWRATTIYFIGYDMMNSVKRLICMELEIERGDLRVNIGKSVTQPF